MKPEEIAEIEARAAKATAGPWINDAPSCVGKHYSEGGKVTIATAPYDTTQSKADAAFIAHARQDIPALISALREAQERSSQIAAWQCIHTDGKTGIVCDEHGNQSCAKDAIITSLSTRIEQLGVQIKRLREALSPFDRIPNNPAAYHIDIVETQLTYGEISIAKSALENSHE